MVNPLFEFSLRRPSSENKIWSANQTPIAVNFKALQIYRYGPRKKWQFFFFSFGENQRDIHRISVQTSDIEHSTALPDRT